MSQTASDRADPSYADLLKIFMAFPAPLALLDATGGAERVNTRFLQRYAALGLDFAPLRALIHDPQIGWQGVGLAPRQAGGSDIKARAVRTAEHVFLVIDEPGAGERGDELDALRARIGELDGLIASDPLTGAWNRAHLDLIIESERARSLASHHPLSLLIFDVDHFKDITDSHGHAVGYSVLHELVKLVRGCIRASDLVFRRDAAQFVVLVSSAGYRGAGHMAEKLRQTVASHAFEDAGTVTISLGVAELDGDEDTRSWFRRMDESLQEAKRGGGNGIAVSRCGNSETWAEDAGFSALNLVWQEDYQCGEPTIDSEHRELFQLANKLMEAALPDNQDSEAVRAAMNELLAHVVRHFADEEGVLDRLNYARLPAHREAHAGLVQRTRWMARLMEERKLHPLAIVSFLTQDVVARHILVVDRAFFPMFRNAAPGTVAMETP